MIGTGFMKWKPMNRSGRSVPEARRVIEIDEVFEVRMVCGARCGTSALKIWCLSASRSVAASMTRSVLPRAARSRSMRDAAERGVALRFGDLAAGDLAIEVAADDLGRPAQRVLGDVVQDHVEAGQREDMGDAVAHLSGADHADALDLHGVPVPIADFASP